jgi:dienelactone hydrolase
MRDFRLDPADVTDIASAYDALLARADVDPARSGLPGTCVGGAFALMGAADERIRNRVSFVCAYAPYASMWTLARDIASATRERDGRRPRIAAHSVGPRAGRRCPPEAADHVARTSRRALANPLPARFAYTTDRLLARPR